MANTTLNGAEIIELRTLITEAKGESQTWVDAPVDVLERLLAFYQSKGGPNA